MNRIILLIGGAMLIFIGAANAQLTVAHIENKPQKKRTEIGLSLQDYNGVGVFLRREIKTNTFLRLDGNINNKNYYQQSHIGLGLEKQISFGNKEKWAFYHGVNLNYYNNRLKLSESILVNQNALTVGYRLGLRYNINKNFFIGAEINPQIGLSHSNYDVDRRGAQFLISNENKIKPIHQLGQATLTFGIKF